MAEGTKLDGVVLWYGGKDAQGADKRFGFIRLKNREEHLFVHGNELLDCGIENLQRNDVIRCRIGESRGSGKPCAIDVELVKRAG